MKLRPGHVLAVLLLVSASAAAQMPSHQSTVSFRKGPDSYQPITGRQRLNWTVKSTLGPVGLAAGAFSAGFGTAMNRPREYGPHWEGFGKRYGMRFTGIATGNLMEASLGALWGEDPRYFRATGQSVKGRIKNVIVMTFMARQADGTMAPAYARYIGTSGNCASVPGSSRSHVTVSTPDLSRSQRACVSEKRATAITRFLSSALALARAASRHRLGPILPAAPRTRMSPSSKETAATSSLDGAER